MTTGIADLGVDIAEVGTTRLFNLGEVTVNQGRFMRYIQAGGAIAVGDFLTVKTDEANEPNVLIPTSAVNQAIAGVASVAIPSGSYGWVVIRGRVPSAKVAASTAAGAQLGSSATPGTASTITIAGAYAQSEVQRVLAAASGIGSIALDAEASGLAEVTLY